MTKGWRRYCHSSPLRRRGCVGQVPVKLIPKLPKPKYVRHKSRIDCCQCHSFAKCPSPSFIVLAAMCRYEAYESGQILFGEDSDAVILFLVLSGVAQVVAKPEFTASLRGVPSESSQAVTEQAVELTRSLECSWTGIRWRAEMHHLSPMSSKRAETTLKKQLWRSFHCPRQRHGGY